MTNEQMKPGRFLKMLTGKRKHLAITEHLSKGGTVYLCTQMRITKLSAKHAQLVRLGKSGSVYLGKDCIDYVVIKFQ